MDSLWKQTVHVKTQKNREGGRDGWMGGWRDGGRDGWIERGRDKWRDGWSNSKCTVKVLHLFSIWLFFGGKQLLLYQIAKRYACTNFL